MSKVTKTVAAFFMALCAIVTASAFASCGGEEKDNGKVEVTLSGITVDSSSATTEYVVGEELLTDGLVVKAQYSDSSEKTLPLSSCTFTGFDSSTTNDNLTITVTYETMTATYSVKIIEFVETTYAGIGKAAIDQTGQVAETLYKITLLSPSVCRVYTTLVGYSAFFECSYSIDEDILTLGECTVAGVVRDGADVELESMLPGYGGLATKEFTVYDGGYMVADPVVRGESYAGKITLGSGETYYIVDILDATTCKVYTDVSAVAGSYGISALAVDGTYTLDGTTLTITAAPEGAASYVWGYIASTFTINASEGTLAAA